jgi:NAD(P)-dependent dehydrogenase (short-subunit alcohol dehydrogenase family)
MQLSFLVTGTSGQQGGATARDLLSDGAIVHAFVRDPTSEASLTLALYLKTRDERRETLKFHRNKSPRAQLLVEATIHVLLTFYAALLK